MKSLEETKAEFARRLAEWRANSVDLPPLSLEDQQVMTDGVATLNTDDGDYSLMNLRQLARDLGVLEDDDEDRELPPVSFDVNLITFDE